MGEHRTWCRCVPDTGLALAAARLRSRIPSHFASGGWMREAHRRPLTDHRAHTQAALPREQWLPDIS
jgi:hypothetical protein